MAYLLNAWFQFIVAFHVIVLLIDEICIRPLERKAIFITRNVIKELFLEAKK